MASLNARGQSYTHITIAGRPGISGRDEGVVETAKFEWPWGIAVDTNGSIFVSEPLRNTIRRISKDGAVSTYAGKTGEMGARDGVREDARFNFPTALAMSSSGVLYVADSDNFVIRKITSEGNVRLVAGSFGASGSNDGAAADARFFKPSGLAVGQDDTLYVADEGNATIRQISRDGEVRTIAGRARQSGWIDGFRDKARFAGPRAITVDAAGYVYVLDSGSSIRRISPGGYVTTIAGSAVWHGENDGLGQEARFSQPRGIAIDEAGNLVVADMGNNTLRRIDAMGMVTTIGGLPGVEGSVDGRLPDSRFKAPCGVFLDKDGTIFVTDTGNHTIRKASVAWPYSFGTLAGETRAAGNVNGFGTNAKFNSPAGIAVDVYGQVYVADSGNHIVRRISAQGDVDTIAGLAGVSGSADGTGTTARFDTPQDVAVDGNGNVYVCDTGNHVIRRIWVDGNVTTIAGLPQTPGSTDGSTAVARFNKPRSLALGKDDVIYVADYNNCSIREFWNVHKVVFNLIGHPESCGLDRYSLSSPDSITADLSDTLFVAEPATAVVRKKGRYENWLSIYAGAPHIVGHVDGIGNEARFGSRLGLATDTRGNVFVADETTVRRIALGGIVDTIAGLAFRHETRDGIGTEARFFGAWKIACDSLDRLYVSELWSHVIRLGLPMLSVSWATPQEQRGRAGSEARIAVLASGQLPIRFRWKKNGDFKDDVVGYAYREAAIQYNAEYEVHVSNLSGAFTNLVGKVRVDYFSGEEFRPPLDAGAFQEIGIVPEATPNSGAFWNPYRKKLLAVNDGDDDILIHIEWPKPDGGTITTEAFVRPWPVDASSEFESIDLAEALLGHLRLQTMRANDLLVVGWGVSYEVQDKEPLHRWIREAQGLQLERVEEGMKMLRSSLRDVHLVGEMKLHDEKRGLVGEESGMRAFVYAYETLLEAAEVKLRILALKAAGKGGSSPEFVAAQEFISQVQNEIYMGYVLMAGVLEESEQRAVGLPFLLLRANGLKSAHERLVAFLPESGDGSLVSDNYVSNPSVDVGNEWATTSGALTEALNSWQEARASERQFDVDQTALREQLEQLGKQYLERLRQIAGENPDQARYMSDGAIFGSQAAVENYLVEVFSPTWLKGELGRQRVLLEREAENMNSANESVRASARRIEIEQRKSGSVAETINGNLGRLKGIDVSRGKASALSLSVTYKKKFIVCAMCLGCCPKGGYEPVITDSGNASYNPGAEAAGRLSAEEREIIANQQLRIEGVQSGAIVENLVMDQTQAQIHQRMVDKDRRAAALSLEQTELEVTLLIQRYQRARTNLAEAYFNNPSYRLLKSESVERAERKLRSVQVTAYRFARRLEYEWAERWPNGLNVSDPQWNANRQAWEYFLGGLHTVFDTVNPHQVQDYLSALREWDRQLRNQRIAGEQVEPTYGQRISFRQDILGFSDYDDRGLLLPEATRIQNKQLFREYILSNVITNNTGGFRLNNSRKSALLLRFPINILSRSSPIANYFSSSISYNHKIDGFDFNLVGNAGLRSPGGGPTARVVLMQRGTAALRTLRATQNASDYSVILVNADPYLSANADLIWGNPNFAIFENATINGAGRSPGQNYVRGSSNAMLNRPVAATEWVMFIDNGLQVGNLNLSFEHLTDIEILVSFRRNSPLPIW
jgi:sugar lactone lactonase YvrE